MSGFEIFCERCGKRYGSDTQAAAGSLPLAKRLLRAVGVGGSTPQPLADAPFLRFCLACRGYSCPECWNEDAGFCQTCVPLPEAAVVEHVHEPIAAAVAEAPITSSFDPFTPPLATDALGTEPWAPSSSASLPMVLEPGVLQPLVLEPDVSEQVVEVSFEDELVVAEPEAVVEDEAFLEAEPEPAVAEVAVAEDQAFVEADALADEVAVEAVAVEADAVAEAVAVEAVAVEADAVAEAVAVEAVAVEADAVAEAVAVEAVAVEADAVAAEVEEVPGLAMAERPIELVAEDDEPLIEAEAEAEAEVRWDWTLEPEEPVVAATDQPIAERDQSESVPTPAVVAQADEALELAAVEDEAAEPLIAAEEEAVVAAEEEAIVAAEEPEAPAEPGYAPPVFRPLTPLGPIVAPPPPVAAAPIPRIEFELPDAPPAYVIAPLRPSTVARPVLPLGLFDGPGPAIRPCPTCELPVSAKAHFCRRCGSAQN